MNLLPKKWRGRPLCSAMLTGICALAAAAQTSLPSHASSDSALQHAFQAAMAAEDRADLDHAETLLLALHKKYPGIFAVNESLGLLIASRGAPSRALPFLQAAVLEQPSSGAAHANLGAALYQLHRGPSALAEFRQAVRIDPRDQSAEKSLGRIALENRKPQEAAEAFLAAHRLQPDDEDLQLDCATALLAADRVDEAQALLAAVADANRSARAQSLLGEVDEKLGRFEAAGKHFDRAVQLEPSEENAWELGMEFLRHWTFNAAIAEFQAASVKFPSSRRMRLGLGAAYFGDAQYARAVPVFADLLSSDPGNATDAELLGIACNAPMPAVDPRCAALVAYARAHPANAGVATDAASYLLLQTDDRQSAYLARKLVTGALAADPHLPDAQYQMGVILQNDGNWKGSIPYLERAVRLKPDLTQAHYRLARAYWKTGRKAEAATQMDLQKKFARQQAEDLDLRMREIIAF